MENSQTSSGVSRRLKGLNIARHRATYSIGDVSLVVIKLATEIGRTLRIANNLHLLDEAGAYERTYRLHK